MTDTLVVPQGTFTLTRPQPRAKAPLRAWDAADEYLLHSLDDLPDGPLLVVNDSFGALSVALAPRAPVRVGDWASRRQAIAQNAARNGAPAPPHRHSFEPWPAAGAALLKVPKSLARLRHQLHRLRACLPPGAPVLAGGMTRHVHTSTVQAFETIIGPTRTTRARKKARLIRATLDPALTPAAEAAAEFMVGDLRVVGQPGVFSADRLDAGTRLLLEHLPPATRRVADLGCGTGVLGAHLAHDGADVVCVDDDAAAVASARATFAANGLTGAFHWTDCLDGVAGSFAAIVNNPPFHEGHAVSDHLAWRMFRAAHRRLDPGGTLHVVANRHLAHHTRLKRLFGNCEVAGSTPKFVVFRTFRQGRH